MKKIDLDEVLLKLNSEKGIIYVNSDKPISSIPLSNRAVHALFNHNIFTIEEFLLFDEADFYTIKNIGKKTISELLTWRFILEQSNGKYRLITAKQKTKAKTQKNKNCCFDYSIPFFYKDGNYLVNTPINELGFSNRNIHALSKNGFEYISDLLNKSILDFKNLGHLGKKSLNEITEVLANWEYKEIAIKDFNTIPYQTLFIANIASYIGLLYKDLIQICLEEEKKGKINNYNDYCTLLYSNQLISDEIEKCIIRVLASTNNDFLDYETLSTLLPNDLLQTNLLNQILDSLKRKNLIIVSDNGIAVKHIKLSNYIKRLPKNRNTKILIERLSGKTLEEIGAAHNVSRERIRQIINKVINTFPVLDEDKFLPIIEKYNITEEEFSVTFETTTETYHYLNAKCSVKSENKLDFESILDDNTISKRNKKRATQFIYKDYMKINSSYVLKKRPPIINYIIKTYCKKTTTFKDFVEIYNRIIMLAPKEDQKNLLIDSERSYAKRIADSKITLWGPHQTFRYYPIDEYDISNFYKELNIEQYNNKEISTMKFLRDNKRLMKKYDLRDEYEIHNFLRKTWDEYGVKELQIDFSRMPHLLIGTANRDKQVMELLFQNAPVKTADLAELYEQEYGVAKASVLANFFICIQKYFDNGIYDVGNKDLTNEEQSFLKNYLIQDFYYLDEIYKVFSKQFGKKECLKLNSFNFRLLNFRLYSGYIISIKYETATEYFSKVLTDYDLIDEQRFTNNITSLISYQNARYTLLKNHTIFEYAKRHFINIERLNKIGITENTIKEFIDSVENFVSDDEYFTFESLNKLGFDNKIKNNAGFDNYLYESILSLETERFSYLSISNTIVFKKGNTPFSLVDFISYIISNYLIMDIYEFNNFVYEKYGTRIREDKIIKICDNEPYYNSVTECIYVNKNCFLEDISK